VFIDVLFNFHYFKFVVIIGDKSVLMQLLVFKRDFPIWIIDLFSTYLNNRIEFSELKNNCILFLVLITVRIVCYMTYLTGITLKQYVFNLKIYKKKNNFMDPLIIICLGITETADKQQYPFI